MKTKTIPADVQIALRGYHGQSSRSWTKFKSSGFIKSKGKVEIKDDIVARAISPARQKRRGLAISAMSLIEIARLSSQGRIRLTPDLETFLSDIEQRFVVFPINAKSARQTYDSPSSFPKDPVNRIIAATALTEDIPLLTADREIRASRAGPTIW